MGGFLFAINIILRENQENGRGIKANFDQEIIILGIYLGKNYRMLYVNMGHNDIDYENKTNKELSFQFANETQNQLIINALLWLGKGKK